MPKSTSGHQVSQVRISSVFRERRPSECQKGGGGGYAHRFAQSLLFMGSTETFSLIGGTATSGKKKKAAGQTIATHSLAWRRCDRTWMKHALSIIFTLVNFSMKLQKDEQWQYLSKNNPKNPFFHVVIGLRVFTRWTGDVHVHAGYNTLWDAVINRRQKPRWCSRCAGGKVPQYHTVDRRELAAGLNLCIETPPLARHHTHTLRSQAELFMLQHRSSPNRGGNCADMR